MNSAESFRLFDCVDVVVDGNAKWASSFLESIGANRADPSTGARLLVEHSPNLSRGASRELDAGVWIERASVFDEVTGVRLDRPSEAVLRICCSAPALEWLMWGLQLVTLLQGLTLVHAAAVEKDGHCVLFPSWGGVGKTALVAHLVRKRGWRLLGDDLVALTPDGNVFAFPKSMVLYPYHRTVFPEVFAAGHGPVAPTALNGLLTSAARSLKPLLRRVPALLELARKHNPQSTRVSPTEVFGANAVAEQGRLRTVIWLERLAGAAAPVLDTAADGVGSRILGSTMNEFDPRCVRLTNVAMGVGIVSAEEVYERWVEILRGGLERADKHLLYIPAATPVAEVPALVEGTVDLGVVAL